MTPYEYIEKALRTLAPSNELTDSKLINWSQSLHALMGLSTEIGELIDSYKKFLFYNKPLDWANLEEEIGDLFWYLAILCDAHGFSFVNIWEKNIDKLKVRYPDKFSEERAINRDLESEKRVINGESN